MSNYTLQLAELFRKVQSKYEFFKKFMQALFLIVGKCHKMKEHIRLQSIMKA